MRKSKTDRRTPGKLCPQLGLLLALLLACGWATSAQAQGSTASHKVTLLANDFVEVYRSPDPQHLVAYSPGIARCPNGRLVATYDLSVKKDKGALPAKVATPANTFRPKPDDKGEIKISDDHGLTWKKTGSFPFVHARPFVAGNSLYVLGQSSDLMVLRSNDWGQTWSPPVKLTSGQRWHQAPCNVVYSRGNVYLVMEHRLTEEVKSWPVSELAPVLMRGKVDADLTQVANWTFASPMSFRQAVNDKELEWFGVPFFPYFYPQGGNVSPKRGIAPIGWLETNVVQFNDPNHYWYDFSGHTFHLFMRAHTGGTGYAALAKVVENPDGTMTTQLEKAPSGKKMLFLPLPGGQMKFHILYDEKTKLYWLLSTQATDSMTKADLLPADRYNLPNNERRRLQLHFSKNCVDWQFAGLVTEGPSDHSARNYASMVIDGDDLHILSRSGDLQAKSAHDGNIITFHTIRNFRDLVY